MGIHNNRDIELVCGEESLIFLTFKIELEKFTGKLRHFILETFCQEL